MSRALLSQIKNDWKENIWLVIELLVVALIIWWLVLNILRTYKDSQYPLGADIENVYAADISYIDENGEKWNLESATSIEECRVYGSGLHAMLARIRDLPSVESAALGSNALPYIFSHMGGGLTYIDGKDTTEVYVNQRHMSPEGAKVLKLESASGLTPDQLQKILEQGLILFSDPQDIDIIRQSEKYDVSKLIGKDLIVNGDPSQIVKAGGLIKTIRRNDYELNFTSGTAVIPVDEHQVPILQMNTLMVRVKPGRESDFEKSMQSEPTLINPQRVALFRLRPLEHDKLLTTWNNEVTNRTYSAGILFLLIIVFIGLLGTFWYRVYLRTPEIAVRKSFGATDGDIFRRFVSEALLLLLAALVLAICLCIALIDKLNAGLLEYPASFETWEWDFALAGLFTGALMALMILIGVGIPAWRAMKIQPAIALKEE
ncbi:MAG: FtsX-like permease family protein [Muribaculaceae bacterium]|nr:FtsX-like permease family protein [Muribaculaceae bacterium]